MERLSSSPRVLDIYGFCGTSIHIENAKGDLHTKIIRTNEAGYMSQHDLDKLQTTDVHPMNNFTAEEKFEIALSMAESLADIHGFEGGTITHADTHIEQWLIGQNGGYRLNDFNNARFPEWNAKKGEYCLRDMTYGGSVRNICELWKVGMVEDILTSIFFECSIARLRSLEVGYWTNGSTYMRLVRTSTRF